MKATKKSITCLLAIVSILALVLSSVAFSASALELTIGTNVTVKEEIQAVGGAEGLDYTKVTYTDANGNGQTLYEMEFNPKTSGLVAMTYQATPSFGAQVNTSIQSAKAEGYEVLGGINGEFFSMAEGNYGTLESRLITNGRIIADSENRNDMCLAIDSDGNFDLVQSQMAYRLYIDGKEVLNVEGGTPIIGTINKRYNGTNWWSPLMYFDSETDGASFTTEDVKGVEVLFEKINGTELVVEGILQGKVLSVTEDTCATPIESNQFVLYAQAGSANYNTLASLTAGTEVQIFADELNADAEAVMKKAISVSAATYPIVVDGKDNTANTPNAPDIYSTAAQRTAIGVKADGTMVFVGTAGRGESAKNTHGLTLPELAELMIDLGCEKAVNLDGGGSSTFQVESKKKLTTGRKVASAILICKRNDATSSPQKCSELESLIAKAQDTTFEADQKEAVDAAVAQAQAVVADKDANTGSMTGDYVREAINLKTAMGIIKVAAPKNYISLLADDWTYDSSVMQAANAENGDLVLNNTNNQWPWASYACSIDVPAGEKLYYDLTIAGQGSIQLMIDGEAVLLNDKIAPDSLDAGSGDIVGGGKRFTGVIDLSTIKEGAFNLSSVMICTVGGAGDASKVTVHHFDFTEPPVEEEDPTTTTTTTTASTETTTTTVAAETTTTTRNTGDTPKNDSPKTADIGQVSLFLAVAMLAAAAIVMASTSSKKVMR